MSILSFIHTILRNIILYFGPLLFIALTLTVNLSNTALIKESFKNNNLYEQLSLEIKKVDVKNIQIDTNKNSDPNFIKDNLNKIYDTVFWQTIGQKLATKSWVENVINTNIDRGGDWINGKTNQFQYYLPEDEINQALKDNTKDSTSNQNLLQSATNTITNQYNNVANDPQVKKQIDELNKEVNNQFANQIKQLDTNNYLAAIPQIQDLPLTLRNYFLLLKNWMSGFIIFYILVLIGFVIIAPLFGKKLFSELSSICLNLSISTFTATISILLSLAFFFLSSILLRAFLASGLQQLNILNILGWQGFWTSLAVFIPLLIGSAVLFVVGYTSRLIRL
jgi:hypothetical protein